MQGLPRGFHHVVRPDPDHVTQGQRHDFTGAETDDLRVQRLASAPDANHFSHARTGQRGSYRKARDGSYAACRCDGGRTRQLCAKQVQVHAKSILPGTEKPGNKAKIRPKPRDVVC
jgi:hypothetical protein